MLNFKTFDEPDAHLRQHRMFSTADELKAAVEREAHDLAELHAKSERPTVKPGSKRFAKLCDRLTEDAQRYYLEDINGWLADPDGQLTSADVLCHRRKATAWAIARRLHFAE